jgi:hypothetical protein
MGGKKKKEGRGERKRGRNGRQEEKGERKEENNAIIGRKKTTPSSRPLFDRSSSPPFAIQFDRVYRQDGNMGKVFPLSLPFSFLHLSLSLSLFLTYACPPFFVPNTPSSIVTSLLPLPVLTSFTSFLTSTTTATFSSVLCSLVGISVFGPSGCTGCL